MADDLQSLIAALPEDEYPATRECLETDYSHYEFPAEVACEFKDAIAAKRELPWPDFLARMQIAQHLYGGFLSEANGGQAKPSQFYDVQYLGPVTLVQPGVA